MKAFSPIMLALCVIISAVTLHYSKMAIAKDLGTFGETYPIAEEDFLEFIKRRLSELEQQGEWKKVQEKMVVNTEHYRDRPTPVAGINMTTQTRTFLLNPGITLDHDVTDSNGKLIAKAGSFVNPLIFVPLTKTLIFYNADDAAQVKWAQTKDRELKGKDKLILVGGSVQAEEKRFNKSIFFDQSGRLTTRFKITHVPAFVSQDGVMLKITEVTT